MEFKKGEKIVFIGDRITEDHRFQDKAELGLGYVRYINEYITSHYPHLNLQIVNKGISGNGITDLKERWEEDVINENPDWLSVSIGINDGWRQLDQPHNKQMNPERFMNIYRELLITAKEKTDAKFIIMEPTVIEENESSEGNNLLKEYAAITRMLSEEFDAILIPMHDQFTEYIRDCPENKLTTDGIHMNSLGRTLMSITWLERMHFVERKQV